jgi:hypothetical protein
MSASTLDANSGQIVASRQNFITGLSGAEGATIGSVAGDCLFSSFGEGHLIEVRGFIAGLVLGTRIRRGPRAA